jgi:hypothetical protein
LEAAHLAKAYVLKLAHQKNFKVFQLCKEDKTRLISEIHLAKDQEEKRGELFTAKPLEEHLLPKRDIQSSKKLTEQPKGL